MRASESLEIDPRGTWVTFPPDVSEQRILASFHLTGMDSRAYLGIKLQCGRSLFY